jgi:hypothetical protein
MIGRENHLTTKHPLKYSTRIDQTLLHFKFELASFAPKMTQIYIQILLSEAF